MSLAQRQRDRILAAQTLSAATAPVSGADHAPAAAPPSAAGATNASPADRAAAQIVLRLTHDLRRLKQIRSIGKKIEAKREMLPEYKAWVEGILAADVGIGTGLAAEVLPTYMVWLIDIGAYAEALDLVPFVFRHDVQMPSRYQRDAATIVVEEIADAAAKAQNAGTAFPLDVLLQVEQLTSEHDLHDEVRAKLFKAIGIEQLRSAEELPAGESKAALEATLTMLRAAHGLNDRVGVKERIKRADKLLAAINKAAEPATEQSGATAA
jgi:hypothetical protein